MTSTTTATTPQSDRAPGDGADKAISNLERPHFFDLITGSPGTGKTGLLLRLSRQYQEAGWQVVYLSIADDRVPNHPRIQEAVDFDNALDIAHNYADVLFSIDEVPDFLPSGEKPDPRLVKILRLRRHLRYSVLATAQCPWDLNVKGRKLWNRIYFFPLTWEGEKWLEREGCPDTHVPSGHYGIYDRAERQVTFHEFHPEENDWR